MFKIKVSDLSCMGQKVITEIAFQGKCQRSSSLLSLVAGNATAFYMSCIGYFLIFGNMSAAKTANILTERHIVSSIFLGRDVNGNFYLPLHTGYTSDFGYAVNDGQGLVTMKFEEILDELYETKTIKGPFMCRDPLCKRQEDEYGTAMILDYKGRGAKAALYNQFIFKELLPFIRSKLFIYSFKEKSFAGFSLGGLCALDIVWNHPQEFSKVGIFSGSLWWRDKGQDDADFNEDTDRIMHRQVREDKGFYPWLKFFFEVGTLDEVADEIKTVSLIQLMIP